MNKVRLEILGLSASHTSHGSFALVLGEKHGNRRLPIIIGMFEAQAIALEIEKISSNRPMTHDLFKNFALKLGASINHIQISNLKEGVFYADIHIITADGEEIVLDSRPSDAVAIGIRFNAPIYAYENIMGEAGIQVEELEQDEVDHIEDELEEDDDLEIEDFEGVEEDDESSVVPESSGGDLSSVSLDQLNKMLQKAIDEEDYMKAAQLRDEITKRQ
ncbi:bifunctional nuclease family protein [Flammeovirga sp. EKP202]|uniref:bifunctional nuclease family protein n=1 Tax=Flammeovirga sp. EKP202 TaxID=2770592 RepID=UPI00165EF593|nr:bifunctional nuclease family protein [Flammeovirga sp. EKP202]MBD0402191.1 bifunctional nuclease family protein [Flammeovirga sp. EKP202]